MVEVVDDLVVGVVVEPRHAGVGILRRRRLDIPFDEHDLTAKITQPAAGQPGVVVRCRSGGSS